MATGAKRATAWLVSGLVVAGTAAALASLLFPSLSRGIRDRLGRTALGIGFASLVWVSIANAVARGAPRLVGRIGVAMALFGLAVAVLGGAGFDVPEAGYRAMAAADAVAALAAVVCQIALAQVSPGGRWVRLLLLGCAIGFDALVILALLEVGEKHEEAWGVLGVLLVASTVLLGLLHWLGAPRPEGARCPRCGEPAAAPTGEFACRACGTRFRVDVLA